MEYLFWQFGQWKNYPALSNYKSPLGSSKRDGLEKLFLFEITTQSYLDLRIVE